jgi:hypothetical protein
MPLVEVEDTQIAAPLDIGDPIIEGDSPGVRGSFKEKLRAAYRLENTLGSFISQEANLPDSAVTNPNFNPWDSFTEEEKLDERFVDSAILADNTEEIEAVRRQFERERADRRTLENGGMAAIMLAASVDPINFIPVGGTAYRTYRTGGSILKGAMATSAVAAGTTAATEGLLLHTQLERTYGESAVNIGAATLFGGVLGATPIGLKKLFSDSGVDFDKAIKEVEESFDPEPVVARGENPSRPMGDTSVGAAQVMDNPEVRGKLAKAVAKFLGWDPLSRTITSEERLTRLASNRLAENPIDTEGGLTRQSVETRVKTHFGTFYRAYNKHLDAYKQYKAEGGGLTKAEFREAVSKAMRNPVDNVHVQRAADAWDAEVYQPLKKEAIDARLLPDDVDVTTAERYLNRSWNKQKIAQKIDQFNEVVTKWLIKNQSDLDLNDARGIAGEIAGRIMSTPDGRLPYDYKIGQTASGGSAAQVPGTFKKRSFDIPDDMVEDFLNNDIEELAYRYIQTTAPAIEMTKEFGPPGNSGKFMEAEIKSIDQAYIDRMENAKTGKERAKLKKQRDADIRDLSAMRDRILGVYNIPDSENVFVRIGRVTRDLNYMRLLGGVVASSIPDVARVTAAEGISNTFKFGLKPLVKNLRGFKAAGREAKEWGLGLDALIGGRAEIIADTADYAKGGTAFERAVRSAANKFSSVNLMNQWTGAVKQLHAVTVQNRVVAEMQQGVFDKRLNQLGIDEGMYNVIRGQVKKHARKIDGVWVMNTADWENADAIMAWKAAMVKESDRVIIVPGQERPLFMSTEWGKTIFQFKTFMLSATQRILVSNLQRQDKAYMQGIMSMITLGMMSYAFKQWDAGREISNDPATLVMEGIDRSGMLGILMEVNNTMEKISSNNVGLRPLLGVSAPASRYASRSVAEGAMGPTFGLLGDTIKTLNGLSNGQEWTEADTRALRRLLPGQNLSILRQGLDEIEAGVNKSLGVN